MPFNLKFDHTPTSEKPGLCETCRWAHIVRGSEGELHIRCGWQNTTAVRMKVIDCTAYTDKKSQTLDEMKQCAWLLGTKKIVGLAGGRVDDVQITWTKPEDRHDSTGAPERRQS